MTGANEARIRKQIVTLAIAATAVVAAGAGIEAVEAQYPGQQMDYYQSAPSHPQHRERKGEAEKRRFGI